MRKVDRVDEPREGVADGRLARLVSEISREDAVLDDAGDARRQLLDAAVHHVARAGAQNEHHRRRRRDTRAGDAGVGVDDGGGDGDAGTQTEQRRGSRCEFPGLNAGASHRPA